MPTDPTPDLLALLDTLDGLHKAATEGEWQFEPRDGPFVRRPVSPRYERGIQWLADAMTVPDGASVVALHNAYPRLAAALRTALTPTTDGERAAREAASGDICGDLLGTYYDAPECDLPAGHGGPHAHGMEGMVSVAHLRTALNLLAIERAKAADAARERAAIVAFLRDGIVQMAAEHYGNELQARSLRTLAQFYSVAADAIERGAHTKVTP